MKSPVRKPTALEAPLVVDADHELGGRAGARLTWRGDGHAIRVNAGTLRLTNVTLVREGPSTPGQWGSALVVVGSAGRLVATGCTFVNSAGAGVEVGWAADVALDGCAITDAATTGIVARGSATVRVTGGSVERCGVNGVHALGASIVVLDGVAIRGSGCRGIEVADVAEVVETGCVVEGSVVEPRATFGLGMPFSEAPYPAAFSTVAEATSWVIAALQEPSVPVGHRARVIERARAHGAYAFGDALPEPFATLVRCAESVKGRVEAEGWSPLEVELWRTAPETCAALGLGRPSFVAAWVVEREEEAPRVSVLAAEGDVLWTGDSDGVLCRGTRVVARLDGPIVTVSVRDGRVLAQVRGGDVHLLDAATGTPVATWRQAHVSGAIEAITPLGSDAILALCDREGHPTDRCSRVFRVAPGTAVTAGLQLAITQGESITVNPTDDPPGWTVSRCAAGLTVQRPDGSTVVLPSADPWGFKLILAGGRWLATIASGGPATLWSVDDAKPVATLPCQAVDAVRVGDAVVILDRDGRLRWIRVFLPEAR